MVSQLTCRLSLPPQSQYSYSLSEVHSLLEDLTAIQVMEAEKLVPGWSTGYFKSSDETTESHFRGHFDLFTDLYCYGLHCTHHTQMGYIIVQLPGIYGNVNQPSPRAQNRHCPQATPSDLVCLSTAINPRQLAYNYYGYKCYLSDPPHAGQNSLVYNVLVYMYTAY